METNSKATDAQRAVSFKWDKAPTAFHLLIVFCIAGLHFTQFRIQDTKWLQTHLLQIGPNYQLLSNRAVLCKFYEQTHSLLPLRRLGPLGTDLRPYGLSRKQFHTVPTKFVPLCLNSGKLEEDCIILGPLGSNKGMRYTGP